MTGPNGTESHRARTFRFALDPTLAQVESFTNHAGAARWAYNHALGIKIRSHRDWKTSVAELVARGIDEAEARAEAKRQHGPIPSKLEIQKAWNRIKGDSRTMTPGLTPWFHEISTATFQSAFIDADQAWSSWMSSVQGERRGRPVGYPSFRAKARARESFRIYHNAGRPSIRPVGYRRMRVPRLGELRIHGTLKPLVRRIDRGEARIQSVTISKRGHRWYLSVLCRMTHPQERASTATQRARGCVGVDVGIATLATLSTGEKIPNPRHLRSSFGAVKRAQRRLRRAQPGSRRRERARARLARLKHQVALRRAGDLHELTKRLATGWGEVAIEDLGITSMTRSARGTLDAPGHHVRLKASLNRAVLDSGFGILRRQLEYKTTWYGSQLHVISRWAPTSKTCSRCGWRKPSLKLTEREFHCQGCGLELDRDINAAINIRAAAIDNLAWQASVASGSGETTNARGGPVRPQLGDQLRRSSMKREGASASPRRGNSSAPGTATQLAAAGVTHAGSRAETGI